MSFVGHLSVHGVRIRRTTAPVSVVAAIAVVATSVLSGCSSSGSPGPSSPPTSAPATQTGSTSSALSGAAALVPASVRAKGALVNAMDATYPPYEYVGTDGHTILGMDPDMLKAIASELDLEIKLVNANFATIIPGLTSGKYGIGMSSFIDTAKRQEQVDFVTYLSAASAFYVKAGAGKSYDGLDSLCGAKVAVENGTTQQATAQAQATKCTSAGKPADTVLTFSDQNGANLALSSGRADLGFADAGLISYLIKQSNGQFAVTGKPLPNEAQTGITLPKGDGMAKAVQAAIEAMMQDGTYASILEKWGTQSGAITKPLINMAKS